MKPYPHEKMVVNHGRWPWASHSPIWHLPTSLRTAIVWPNSKWVGQEVHRFLASIYNVVEEKTMSSQRRTALFEVIHGLGQMISIIESVKQSNQQDSDLQQAVQHLEGDLIRTVGAFHETINDLFEQDDGLIPPSADLPPKAIRKKDRH
jgi:hypothetical protein